MTPEELNALMREKIKLKRELEFNKSALQSIEGLIEKIENAIAQIEASEQSS